MKCVSPSHPTERLVYHVAPSRYSFGDRLQLRCIIVHWADWLRRVKVKALSLDWSGFAFVISRAA